MGEYIEHPLRVEEVQLTDGAPYEIFLDSDAVDWSKGDVQDAKSKLAALAQERPDEIIACHGLTVQAAREKLLGSNGASKESAPQEKRAA